MKSKQIHIVTFYTLLTLILGVFFFMVINNIVIINRVTTQSEDGQNILMDAIWFNTSKAAIIFMAAAYCGIEGYSKYKFFRKLNFREQDIFAKYPKPIAERDTFDESITPDPSKYGFDFKYYKEPTFERAKHITDVIDHTTNNKIKEN